MHLLFSKTFMIIDFNLFQSNVAFQYPLKELEHLIFSLGIEMEHWTQMG